MDRKRRYCWRSVTWFMFAFFQFCDSTQPPTYYELPKLCEKTTFDMDDANVTSGMFNLFPGRKLWNWVFECRLKFKAPPGHRILLGFANEDIQSGIAHSVMNFLGVCSDYVLIYGHENNDRTSEVKLCGGDPPKETFKSSGREVTMKVFRNTAKGKGYKMFFNSFHTGTCTTGEFKCDNGYCIDARLRCNDYNNCGDGSDVSCSSLVPRLAGVGCGVVLFCLCLAGLYSYKKRKHAKTGEETSATEMTTVAAPSQAAVQSSLRYIVMSGPSWQLVRPPHWSTIGPARLYDQPARHPSVPPPYQGTSPAPQYLVQATGPNVPNQV